MTVNGTTTSSTEVVPAISSGITITGNVECEGEIQINGLVNGEVRAGTVFVDTNGRVAGGVIADRLRAAGQVEGNIQVGDLVIEADGDVRGDVRYGRIKIAAGGSIDGSFARTAAPKNSHAESPVKLVETAAVGNPRRVYVD